MESKINPINDCIQNTEKIEGRDNKSIRNKKNKMNYYEEKEKDKNKNFSENENQESNKIKIIEYKGKQKRIPANNEDPSLCEFYIIKKSRYCRFKKTLPEDLKNSSKIKNIDKNYCVYHQPIENSENEFILCPIFPTHSVLKSNLKAHLFKCTFITNKEKNEANIWYKKDANVCNDSIKILKEENLFENLEDFYQNKSWENLPKEKYVELLDKILYAFEILRQEYLNYIKEDSIKEIINKTGVKISAIDINLEKDTLPTKQYPKAEKMEIQNQAIKEIMEKFGIFDYLDYKENKSKEENNNKNESIFIEFGAGKAGLSYFINNSNNDKSIHYLLERGSNRNKKDKFTDKLIRFKADIKDFDIEYLNNDIKNKKFNKTEAKSEENLTEKELRNINSNSNFNFIGIAKHICGCAFDLSVTCLLNLNDQNKVKGFCMATCCHNICRLEYINNLKLFKEKLNFTLDDIAYLFKATSWIFGSIDSERIKELKGKQKDKNENENEESIDDIELEEEIIRMKENEENKKNKNNEFNSYEEFERRGKRKEYFGLISKYIIDLSRCLFLIEKGFDVFYIKYCDNEITTENNLILALKK